MREVKQIIKTALIILAFCICSISLNVLAVDRPNENLLQEIQFGQEGVNAATGNFSESFTDIEVPSPEGTIKISRTYNSKDERTTTLMGKGWTFSFEGSLKNDSNYVVAKFVNGASRVFSKNSDGTYKAYDSRDTLVKLSDGNHVLTTKDQINYKFSPNGYLTEIADRNGNKTVLDVDPSGKVIKITDSVKREYILNYNEFNYIKSVKDPAGRIVSYQYDSSKRLERVIEPQGKTTAYEYDGSTNALTKINIINGNSKKSLKTMSYFDSSSQHKGKVKELTNDLGNKFIYNYDGTYQDKQSNITYKVTTIIDCNNRILKKAYNNNFYIIKAWDYEEKESSLEYNNDNFSEEKAITDKNKNKYEYERDKNGNITKTTYPDKSISQASYDDKNNVVVQKDKDGKATYYVYDKDKINLIKRINPLNGVDEYSETADQSKFAINKYDYYTLDEAKKQGNGLNGLLKSIMNPEGGVYTYNYDEFGNKITFIDEVGNITTYKYNILGQVVQIVSPKGYITTKEYDKAGRLIKIVINKGDTTRIIYDSEGNKIQEINPNEYDLTMEGSDNNEYKDKKSGYKYSYYDNGLIESSTDPVGNITKYLEYDKYGNVIKLQKPNGAIYIYEYDLMNRLKKSYFKKRLDSKEEPILLQEYLYATLPDGKTEKSEITYLNTTDIAVKKTTADYEGKVIKEINSNGGITENEYNKNGTLNNITFVNGGKVYYKYDGLNRETEKWTAIDGANYSYSTNIYDKVGNKIEERLSKEKVALFQVPEKEKVIITYYEYYADGKLKTLTDSIGKKTSYEYDKEGNVSKKIIYLEDNKTNKIEFSYNHLRKVESETSYVRSGDIYGNNYYEQNDEIKLTTNYNYDKNGNLISITRPDNNILKMTYDKLNRKESTIIENSNENGQITKIIETITYDSMGNVVKLVDPMGNATINEYNERGFLVKTIKTTKNSDNLLTNYISVYDYDKAGRKIVEISPKNYIEAEKDSYYKMNRTEFNYNLDSTLKTKVIKYIDTVNNQWISFVVEAYKYDINGNIIKALNGEGFNAGVGVTDDLKIETGYGTEYKYDLRGRVVSTLSPVDKDKGLMHSTRVEYDALGRKTEEINGKGSITTYYYDNVGNVVAIKIKRDFGDGEKTLKQANYNLNGQVISTIDGNGNETKFEYNKLNKLKRVIYPKDDTFDGKSVIYQYDILGNLAYEESSTGFMTIHNYDIQGREVKLTQGDKNSKDILRVSRKAYDIKGNLRFEWSPNGDLIEYKYDELNRKIEVITKVKNVDGKETVKKTRFEYDKNNNVTKTIDWLNNVKESIYDSINRVIETRNSYGTVERFQYDFNHKQTKSYDGNNNYTHFEYDKNNNLIATIDPEGKRISTNYDVLGNISEKIDGNGNITKFEYDELNNLTCVTNAKGEKSKYSYDINGNKLTQTDGKGNTTIFEYNTINKVKRIISSGGKQEKDGKSIYLPEKTEEFCYDSNGNITKKKDRNGNIIKYSYDIYGRKLSEEATDVRVSYTYDNENNVLTMNDASGTTSYVYDEQGRVILKGISGIGVTQFTYDITDKAKGIEEGEVGEECKDVKGNITFKIFDKVGRLKKVKADNEANFTVYEYDINGNKKSVTYANGVKEEFTYYKNNLLKNLINKDKSGVELEKYEYYYDGANNQIKKIDPKGTTSYRYDALNRLEQVDEDIVGSKFHRVTEYTFDGAGNRLTERKYNASIKEVQGIEQGEISQKKLELIKEVSIAFYEVDEQNRLKKITKVENKEDLANSTPKETIITKFFYDNNGNLMQKIEEKTKEVTDVSRNKPKFGMFIAGQSSTVNAKELSEATAYYYYNGFNELVQSKSGSNTVEYTYDGYGLRKEKITNGKTTKYIYESDKVILELDDKGRQLGRNIYGNNLASRIIDGKKVYYLYNGHGDVTRLVGEDGAILAKYYYDAFGNLLENIEKVDNPFKYAGYEYDKETGNYYVKSRYYDPAIARFLSEDTYRGRDDDPLSLNLYTYVHNEPIRYIDPDGHREDYSNGFGETPEMEKLSHTQNAIIRTQGSDGLLRKGSEGNDVKKLQRLLNEAGANLNVDGIFGSGTKQAVINFQRSTGIGVDGIVGTQTWTELKSSASFNKYERDKQARETREAQVRAAEATKKVEEQRRAEEGKKAAEDLLVAALRASIKADLEKRLQEMRTTASLLGSFIPVVGDVKDAQEAITGYDLVAGEKLTGVERTISIISAAVPVVSGPTIRSTVHGVENGFKYVSDAIGWSQKSTKPMLNDIQLLANKGATKADILKQNRVNGRNFETEALGKMKESADDVVEQITIKSKSGTRTRLDAIGIDKETGEILIEEYKASSTAPLTKNQKIAHPEIQTDGGIVVGKGKPPFIGGTEIPPTKIKIIRK